MAVATRRDSLTRRHFISRGAVVGAAVIGGSMGLLQAASVARAQSQSRRSRETVPAARQAAPDLAAFDQIVEQTITRWGLAGGALAISKDGRLVFSGAYGLADVATNRRFETTSICRIASSTKPITAVAILRLIEDGKLALTDRAFRLLEDLTPPVNAPRDARLDDITIQHLLQHTGGWDSARSYDPQYPPVSFWAAGVLGVEAPPSAEQIIRFMLGQPLDFAPGSRYAYSNFGYNVLGRIIERVSGLAYGEFVRQQVLAPAGIGDMSLGRTRLDERAPGEVSYVPIDGQPLVPSVYPGVGYVPQAYGGYFMEGLDAHGGWIGTAEDLIRFATAIDGQRGQAILKPETVDLMLHTPLPDAQGTGGAGNAQSGSGLSWNVVKQDGGLSWSHAGALEATCASNISRRPDGTAIAFVFNSLPTDYPGFFGDIIPSLAQTADGIAAWPTIDLFTDAAD